MFDRNGYILVEASGDPENNIQLLTYKQDVDRGADDAFFCGKRCPRCNSHAVAIHKKKEIVIHDMCEDKAPEFKDDPRSAIPSIITIQRNRYRCRECKKTYYEGKPLEKSRITDDYKDAIIKEVLDNPYATYSDLAKKYDIGNTEISEYFKGEYLKAKYSTESYIDFRDLFLYPFEYNNQVRCAFIAVDPKDNEKWLLDISDSYNDLAVTQFNSHVSNSESVENLFCSTDNQVISCLKKQYSSATISILLQCAMVLRKKLSVDYADGLYNKKLNALDRFINLIKTANSLTFIEEFNKWWNELDEQLKCCLSQVKYSISSCPEEWAHATDYSFEEMECRKFFGEIEYFRKQNVTFENMRYRIMYLSATKYAQKNDASKKSIGRQNFMQIISDYKGWCQPKPMVKYGVKLKDISKYYRSINRLLDNKMSPERK